MGSLALGRGQWFLLEVEERVLELLLQTADWRQRLLLITWRLRLVALHECEWSLRQELPMRRTDGRCCGVRRRRWIAAEAARRLMRSETIVGALLDGLAIAVVSAAE